MSHITTWVSSIEIAPLFRSKYRGDNIALDLNRAFALHEAEDIIFFFRDRDELGHRLAALGDQHGFALGLDFVHDFEAMDFEFACGHFFHRIDLRSWSFHHGPKEPLLVPS